ncbi:MAG: pitrilysin family protein [Cyanobacteria bacterium P01_D01_bin.128]
MTHRHVMPNGLVILVVENPVSDIVSARLLTRAGIAYEAPSQAGLFSLMASVLTKGTAALSSIDIAERVESVGASLGTDAAADYSLLSLKTVSADFPAILALASQLWRSPTFPEPEVELERRLMLQGLRSMQEQPFTMAYNSLRKILYGEHPYGRPNLGTVETVQRLNAEDLRQAHTAYFRPDTTVISIAGRIAVSQAVALVESVFSDWQVPPSPPPALIFPPVPQTSARSLVAQDTHQSIIMLGYQSAPVKAPQYAALKLLNTYLGNGLSSRLFVEMREKRGLAYDVSAFYPTRLGLSQFVAYIGTAPPNTQTALDGLKAEIERLCTTLLSEEELQVAKNKILGQYALGKQTNAQMAQLLGWYEILGLGISFDQAFQTAIAEVTPENAKATALESFTTPFIAALGPEAAIGVLQD